MTDVLASYTYTKVTSWVINLVTFLCACSLLCQLQYISSSVIPTSPFLFRISNISWYRYTPLNIHSSFWSGACTQTLLSLLSCLCSERDVLVPPGGTLTFPAGSTVQFISIPIVEDVVVETEEHFMLVLQAMENGASISMAAVEVTIRDNDGEHNIR